MPPKGSVAARASKIIEDKTFGMKNKNKSSKIKQAMESSRKAVAEQLERAAIRKGAGGDPLAARAAAEAKKAKDAQDAIAKEMAALLRSSVKQPPLAPGVDPKSVLCEFFKAGCCEKGARCKFAHDLAVGRKAAKIDLYSDRRAEDEAAAKKKDETNADWDQAKLEEVVASKHGSEAVGGAAAPAAAAAAAGAGAGAGVGASVQTRTDIVCRYFLDAIEKEIYGWFWRCPNGEGCKYRHALPPGFVFRSKAQRELEAAAKAAEADAVTLEELIEEERKKLPSEGLTQVNAETFARWKAARMARRAAAAEVKLEEAKKGAAKGGVGLMSGRALFAYDPTLFVDDDEAGAEAYVPRADDDGDEAGDAGEGSLAEGDDDDEEGGEDEDEDEEGAEDEDGGEDEEEGEEGPGRGPAAGAGSVDAAAAALAAAAIDESLFAAGDLPPDDLSP